MTLVSLLDLAAVTVFAITGALTASRAQLDPVGFLFLACLVGVGGGTVRDVLLDRAVFWIDRPGYIAVACGAATVVFFTAHLVESRLRWLVWSDSVALAVAVSAGFGVALETGQSAPVAMLIGVITGCLGGLMRDVVVNDVPIVLKQGELYASAAFAGAGAGWVVAQVLPGLPQAALLCAALVTWGLRAGSLAFGWSLPTYKSRPPRM